MLLTLSLSAALAGELVVETRVPAEVVVDGTPAATLRVPSTLTLRELSPGPHALVVFTGGLPHPLDVTVPEAGALRVLVGRESIEVDKPAPEAAAEADVWLELRVAGRTGAQVRLGDELLRVEPGTPVVVTRPEATTFAVEVRSADRLAIWARGELDLVGGDRVTLVIEEGRPIDAFGRAGAWKPDR